MTIFIINNNSKDDTESVVLEIQSNSTRPLAYLKETNQGISHARNAGIGDIVDFIHNGEEIDENWYNVVAREAGHGKMESKERFPLFHAPDCGG